MNKLNDRGFTLIELILFIVIGAIFLPASMIAFTSVMKDYSKPDYYVKAKFYADKRIAEITNNPYDTIGSLGPLGPSSPCSATDEGGGYTTECSIEPVNLDLSTTNPGIVTDNAGISYYTCKRINVTVKYAGLSDNYVVSTLITRRPKL